ncbi:MAG TPA: VOC family protein [Candidatus Saccharimonadales bacterium]|nr:VOC family protein [Candidatus Saccharimonadales bacterium]
MLIAREYDMVALDDIIGDTQLFLRQIIKEIEAEGFDMRDFVQIDHVCYRTTDLGHYRQKQQELQAVATLLSENLVNDRPISTFRLHQPIVHDGWRIDIVELPAPKQGSSYGAGLEHVELVLYDDFDTFLKKYPRDDYEMKASSRSVNPDIGLHMPTFTVKFHLISLAAAVFLENQLGFKEIKDGQ